MAIQNPFGNAKDVLDLLFSKKSLIKPVSSSKNELDKVNIMLAGITGVGKSTLINAVFGEDFAPTGIGAPITQNLDMYEKEGVPLRIYDVKGFELDPAVQKHVCAEMKKLIKASIKTGNRNDDIHLMWYCVSSPGAKFQQFEIEFINDLAKQIDVVLVVTKSYDTDATRELIAYIESKKDSGALSVKAIVPVLAADLSLDGVISKEKFGLKELSDLSYELLPDAQKRAFAAAQKVSEDLRNKAATTAIAFAAAAAAAAGAIPIPIADTAALAQIQLAMFKGIANAYGIRFTEDDFSKMVGDIAPAAAANVGKAAIAALLKRVPGVTVAAMAVSGAVAATLTVALGASFQKALACKINEIDINDVVSEELVEIMKDSLNIKLKESSEKYAQA